MKYDVVKIQLAQDRILRLDNCNEPSGSVNSKELLSQLIKKASTPQSECYSYLGIVQSLQGRDNVGRCPSQSARHSQFFATVTSHCTHCSLIYVTMQQIDEL
jgi:hypothetical protein